MMGQDKSKIDYVSVPDSMMVFKSPRTSDQSTSGINAACIFLEYRITVFGQWIWSRMFLYQTVESIIINECIAGDDRQ